MSVAKTVNLFRKISLYLKCNKWSWIHLIKINSGYNMYNYTYNIDQWDSTSHFYSKNGKNDASGGPAKELLYIVGQIKTLWFIYRPIKCSRNNQCWQSGTINGVTRYNKVTVKPYLSPVFEYMGTLKKKLEKLWRKFVNPDYFHTLR